MAVSLNKREKVDLSKPELPRKLPEITPVHLIDEEETIVKRPSTVVRSDVLPNSDKSHLDEIAPDSISKDEIHHQQKFERLVVILVLVVFAVLIISIILRNLPDNFFQELSKGFQDFSSIVDEVFTYISSNSLLMGILAISFIFIGIRLIRKLLDVY